MSVAVIGGGRHFARARGNCEWQPDKVRMAYAALDQLAADNSITVVAHGGADGADTLAGMWAKERGIEVRVHPADWGQHGRSAGPIRNREMLKQEKPDLVIAFPGGRGTDNLCFLAESMNLRVVRIGM